MTHIKPVSTIDLLWAAVCTVPESRQALHYWRRWLSSPAVSAVVGSCSPSVLRQSLPRPDTVLRNAWLLSHVVSVVATATFAWSQIWADPAAALYRVAAIASIVTYLLVTCRHIVLLANHPPGGAFSVIVRSENTHILASAVLAAVSSPSVFKLASSAVYSYLNLATFLFGDVIPETSLAAAAVPLLDFFEPRLLVGAATVDLALVGAYVLEPSTPSFAVLYLLILGSRLEGSQTCQLALKQVFGLTRSLGLYEHVCDVLEDFFIPNEHENDRPAHGRRISSYVFDDFEVAAEPRQLD